MGKFLELLLAVIVYFAKTMKALVVASLAEARTINVPSMAYTRVKATVVAHNAKAWVYKHLSLLRIDSPAMA